MSVYVDGMEEQEVLVIDLNPRTVECIACGQMTAPTHGLPMREGEFLENDDVGEWAGFTCCRSCYEIHRLGGVAALRLHLAALARLGRAHHGEGGTMSRSHDHKCPLCDAPIGCDVICCPNCNVLEAMMKVQGEHFANMGKALGISTTGRPSATLDAPAVPPRPEEEPFKSMPSREAMRAKIDRDPDLPCEAGLPPSRAGATGEDSPPDTFAALYAEVARGYETSALAEAFNVTEQSIRRLQSQHAATRAALLAELDLCAGCRAKVEGR